jgi:sugar/nucleoside kinase (ribokinase family)
MNSCDILFIGETTHDILGVAKEDISSERVIELASCEFRFGGKAANAAVSCAKMGAKVAYIGTVGDDFERLGYREYSETNQVNIDNVFVSGNKTPIYVAFRFNEKNYSFHRPSKLSKNQFVHLRDHFVKHTSSITARVLYCALRSDQLVLEIFEHARQSGKKTAWNPILFSTNPEQIESILRITDYLFVNESEAQQLEKLTAASISQFYSLFGLSMICMTLGERGCKLINQGAVSSLPAIKVQQVFNTTGAGDAFAGAFLGAIILQKSESIEDCAKIANSAAAEVVARQERSV